MQRLLKFLAAGLMSLASAAAFELPSNSSQCVVGIADHWNTSHVTLTRYEKRGGQWAAVGQPWTGRLGKNGLVWGRGINPVPASAKLKQESDGRAPAGVFRIGGAWGVHPSIQKHAALPYRQVTTRDLWVEDPASPKYNHHLVIDHEPATPWEKKAQMRQDDYPHSLKLFIAHNAPPKVVPNGGSAIFFHIWRGGGGKPTAGCTTMEEKHLRSLIGWIDPGKNPLYILLPRAEYQAKRAAWKLP